MNQRVVITGCGFVLPLGNSSSSVLQALKLGHGPFIHSQHDPQIAICPIPDFELKTYIQRFKNARYLTRGQQLALAAALLAVQDAGWDSQTSSGGIFLGLGPNLQAQPRSDKALWLLDFLPNTLAACLAQLLGLHGENLTISTACAASTQALGQAYHAIATGRLTMALAGGGDSRLSAPGLLAYKQAGVLATQFIEPYQACRPFDQQRNGFAVGEGGAIFVLENLKQAQKRKAPIIAEIVSAAATLDGHSLTSPDPQARAGQEAVQRCLQTMDTQNLCIVAHGTGTKLNDAMESKIMTQIPQALGICAFKSYLGHLAAACGGAELAVALICARQGWFPAIANLEQPCAPHLPFLRQPANFSPQEILVQSFGFGGQNACLGVRLWT